MISVLSPGEEWERLEELSFFFAYVCGVLAKVCVSVIKIINGTQMERESDGGGPD